ncbi:bifunctional riboflavin kinase/FAD synthetase [Sphingobium boeckii]|uniref:Riboflavin biosynthesis protein n=1 Tax=Sphingobium boeckii TaxID=1082345 RepID=A0A7W9EDA2_9SPHN|nr:bifunctional riboflavin kinase/FAD synthetase [Sphingobium boeckii]MBB5684739.1 riboflavin kinase/FMN adenylyltransferase [Sphingobium boeckii]
MQRLSGERRVPDDLRGGVIALGNFDGFHRGHQAVVGSAVALAREQGRPALVATFDPHPIRYFKPDAPPFRLTTLDQRERLFAEAGADAMLVFTFDDHLAALTAQEFVEQRLIDLIGAAGVVTGEDFTFGKDRGGNVRVLAELGQVHGLTTEAVGPVAEGDETISSSRIRTALQAGDCETATRLLTRPFAIQGDVIHGDKLGRTIGYPTANVSLGHYLRPRYGIYAVRGRLADGRVLEGAANLGIRPTFDPPKELLEPYFFDFHESLYGQVIEVELIRFLRPEMKFDGIEPLVAQMDKDCAEAKRVLAES